MTHTHPQRPGGKFGELNLRVALALCSISALAWIATYQLMTTDKASSEDMIQSILMPSMAGSYQTLDTATLSLFLIIWLVGMIAMMFPAMIPVISIYEKLSKTATGALGVALFLGGYLAVYASLGFLLHIVLFAGFQLTVMMAWLSGYALQLSGVAMIVAGIWQLTPLKETCLSHCSSPLGFFLKHTKPGLLGAARMGVTHGTYCVGCCWTYMLIMVAVAALSIPSMILLAIVITLEKAIFKGARWFTWLTAFGFAALGVLLWMFSWPPGIS